MYFSKILDELFLRTYVGSSEDIFLEELALGIKFDALLMLALMPFDALLMPS